MNAQQSVAFQIAKSQIGFKEIPGPDHNKKILEYHTTCLLQATNDETPWCSAFANWCFIIAGLVVNRREMISLLIEKRWSIRHFDQWTKSADEFSKEYNLGEWLEEPITLPTLSASARSFLLFGKEAKGDVGDLIILKRGLDPIAGHVGFVCETRGDVVTVLGGNQSNEVKLSLFNLNDLLGFRSL